MKTPMPHSDLMDIDDILVGYEDELTPSQTLAIKIGTACSDRETRQNMEPVFGNSIRALRKASIKESRMIATWDHEQTT